MARKALRHPRRAIAVAGTIAVACVGSIADLDEPAWIESNLMTFERTG
jgi:hypothetical protein